MRYLRLEMAKPRVGVFDFTCCEGCELQLTNKEETLVDFLSAIEVVEFREASSSKGGEIDVALVEGAITRADEVERLKAVRARAKVLVAYGTCAVSGGVNRLKNPIGIDEANRIVYGDKPQRSLPVRAVKEVVKVDLEIPGCPVNKDEVERIVRHLIVGAPFEYPVYPVCMECKHRFTTCLFEKGTLCLGSITRAGCTAPCPAGGIGCWGCRGPAADPNYEEFFALAKRRGFSDEEVAERLAFFGTFEGVGR